MWEFQFQFGPVLGVAGIWGETWQMEDLLVSASASLWVMASLK